MSLTNTASKRKQWQPALQEALQKLRRHGRAVQVSIELLDRGYRAVDPPLKLRYLINEAPADAPLTGSAEASKRLRQQGRAKQ